MKIAGKIKASTALIVFRGKTTKADPLLFHSYNFGWKKGFKNLKEDV